MAKTVIVSCGTGIATSTVLAVAIEEACKKEGVGVIVGQNGHLFLKNFVL